MAEPRCQLQTGVGSVGPAFLCSQLFYHIQVQHLTETFGLLLLAHLLGGAHADTSG